MPCPADSLAGWLLGQWEVVRAVADGLRSSHCCSHAAGVEAGSQAVGTKMLDFALDENKAPLSPKPYRAL